jgi:ParB family transcriptional regulator, chromosome partitioning protein
MLQALINSFSNKSRKEDAVKVDKIRMSDYLGLHRVQTGYMPLKNVGEIDPQDIIAPLDRAPREYDHEELRQLGHDIQARGQLEPVRVYWSADHGKWVLVTGERRWRAVLEVNLFRITCTFLDYEPTTVEILSERLVEVFHRKQPDQFELARNCRELMNFTGWSAREVATNLHISEGKLSKALSMLSLPVDVIDAVQSKAISAESAYLVSTVANADDQRRLADDAINGKMTQREVKQQMQTSGVETRAKRSTPRKPTRGNRRIFKTSGGVTITLSHRRRLTDQDVSNALREAMNLADRAQQGAA